MFPPVIFSLAVIEPVVPRLPTLALPDTLTLVNVPVLVIFGCAFVVTVCALVEYKFATKSVEEVDIEVVTLKLDVVKLPVATEVANIPVAAVTAPVTDNDAPVNPVFAFIVVPLMVVAFNGPMLELPDTLN